MRTSNLKVNWKTGQIQWDLSERELASIKNKPRREKLIRNSKVFKINVIIKEPKTEQPVEAIPEEYQRYAKLFSEKLETGLPKYSK